MLADARSSGHGAVFCGSKGLPAGAYQAPVARHGAGSPAPRAGRSVPDPEVPDHLLRVRDIGLAQGADRPGSSVRKTGRLTPITIDKQSSLGKNTADTADTVVAGVSSFAMVAHRQPSMAQCLMPTVGCRDGKKNDTAATMARRQTEG